MGGKGRRCSEDAEYDNMNAKKLAILSAIAALAMVFAAAAVVQGSEDSAADDAYQTLVVGDGDGEYATIAAALEKARNGDHIQLAKDVEEDVTIAAGNVVLDLNGHKLTNVSSDTITVALGAELIITDSSDGKGTVDNVTDGKAAVFNNGTVTIQNGKFIRSLETGVSPKEKGDNSFYTVLNHGIMTVENGTFENSGKFSSLFENGYYTYASTDSRSGYVESTNQTAPSLTINGGSFSGGVNAIKNDDGGVLEITGGTFENVTQFCVMTYSNASITGGTYKISDSASAAIYCKGDKTAPTDLGKLGISGNLGKIILANDADVTLSGDVTTDVIVCGSGAATIDLNGHKLTNASDDTITVALGASLTITGNGTVDNLTNGKADVFNNGTVVIENGKFTRSAETGVDAKNSGGNSYYNLVNHGKMTISDAEVTSSGHFSSLVENGYIKYASTNSREGYIEGANAANPELTINGGHFTGGINTVKNDDGGILKITAGTFENVTQNIVLNWNEATISGGEFNTSSDLCAVYSYGDGSELDSGKLTVTGGTFNSTVYIHEVKEGSATISGGTFNGSVVIDETIADAVTVTGGTFADPSVLTHLTDGADVTITLNSDVSCDVVIPAGKVTLDLNGHKLTNVSSDTIAVMLNAVLIIKDSSNGKGTVDNVTDGKAAVYNNGTVTIENGTLTRSADTADSSNYYVILNHGSMVINDVIVKSAGAHASLIDNGYYGYKSTGDGERIAYFEGIGQPNPSLTINRGIFDGGLNTVKNDDGGVLNIAGGTFENVTQACIQNHNVAIIDGGIFNAIRGDSIFYAIDNCGCAAGTDEGDLTINGGTFSGYFFIDADDIVGTVVINGGTFSEYLIQNYNGNATVTKAADVKLSAPIGYSWNDAGKLAINQYKVTYLTVDAAVLSEVTVDYGSSVTAPADPVRGYNYAFDGWLLDGKACTFPFKMLAEDLSIVASWEIIVPAADTETNKISVDADEYGAQFSSDSMQTIVDSATSDENVTLSVSIGDGISVVFDNAALRNFGNGAAELTVGSVAAEDMSDALKSLVGDGAVYTISFGSNTNFGDGTATVTLPFALSDGQNESDMYIAYIVDGKVAEKFDCTYSDGAVTFATGHFSTYAIMFDDSSDDDSSDDGSFAFALIVAIVIVALVLAAIFLAGRSKSA